MTTYRRFDRATEFLVQTISGPIAGNGDNNLIPAPGANHRIVLSAVTIQNESGTATLLRLTNGVGGATIERIYAQNQGDGLSRVYPFDARPKLADNTALILNLSGANACGCTIHYYIE